MKSADPVPERLLAAARELFTRQGYDGTSVREITSRAKANLGAVTYHFGSKQALYHAAIARMAEPLADRIAEAAQLPGTPIERLGAMMRGFLEHVAEDPGAPTCLLRELAGDRPIAPPLAKVMQRNFSAIIQTIIAGQQDGSIRPGDPKLLLVAVVPHTFYLAVAGRLLKGALGLDFADPDRRAQIIENATDAIRRSLLNDTKATA
jgi:AcrR family transcriptional regulator